MRDSFAYFPQRVSGGSMENEGLLVRLRDRNEVLPWDKIRMVFLGIVEDPLLTFPPSPFQRMKDALGKLFSPGAHMKDEGSGTRENIYIEMFVEGKGQAYRFETTSLDYSGFLADRDYVSANNLKKFLAKLTEKLPGCKFDHSLSAYLANQKPQIAHYKSIYEFQRESWAKWEKEKQKNA